LSPPWVSIKGPFFASKLWTPRIIPRGLFLFKPQITSLQECSLVDLTRYVTSKLQISNSASIEYIHTHYKESIRLETLAKIEHYHPVYYSAWFKKKTGKGLKAYLSELRLKEAKHLLHSTSWAMSKISEELGFENSSSFTRWFVNSEGISPQKFRILNKG
ncbi:MAG TPA: helix-turn-helix transcriptional regulator, partial [Bacillales bacterium]|nr:helix-turn-helix transcriptional regulator [Bacillales bacterium]